MFETIFTVENLAALGALTVMEIILGIDNVVFISVLVSRLPREQAERARKYGLMLALVMRLALLFMLTWLLKLTQPLFSIYGLPISWREIILFFGGLFLVLKATHEMHVEMEGGEHLGEPGVKARSFGAAMAQIAVIDLVFSLDSMITAIGMARELWVMVVAVLISMAVMYMSAGPVSAFVHKHPTTKMLALAFLVLIGVALMAEAIHKPIDRGLIYGAMAFAVLVEMINLKAATNRMRKRNRHRDGASEEGAEVSDKARE
jgi:predicted tellurium resistance membrane protein TerC